MIKYFAIAWVAGVMLLAGADANACGSEVLLAGPMTPQSEMDAPQPGPKDKPPAQQGGK